MLIDANRINEALLALEGISTNHYSDHEKDIELLLTSLHGILKKNFGRTQEEKTHGLELIEKSRKLSDEIKLIYERIKWL